MKTTLDIDETLIERLRKMANREGQSASKLVNSALRQFLKARKPASKSKRLPVFDGGPCRVDISNHDELSRVMGDS